MSLLGIDAGTTGCKVAVFADDGRLIALAYREYDIQRPSPGCAELDSGVVWENVRQAIRQAVMEAQVPIRALSVASIGEALVPVDRSGQAIGPSILNFDERGAEFLPALAERLPAERLYGINGNTLGNHFSLTKLAWIRAHQPELYERTDKFLLWSSYIACRLGAEPGVDYSLANRTLLFDIDRQDWSQEILHISGIDPGKLAALFPSDRIIGRVSRAAAEDLGLPQGALIAAGAHDQCANAVGCGVISPGLAVYGMGTFHCITPVLESRKDPAVMMSQGLNTEHHAVPGRFVSFIYNQGGSLVKWFRDTFAAAEHRQAQASGQETYPALLAEMPERPGSIVVLPHFATTGPPGFISDSSGVMAGLRLETRRGEILKGIIEGVAYYLKACVDALPETGIEIDEYRVVGGGSRSAAWIQVLADILERPFVRPQVSEAGALGAAIIAGCGSGVFASFAEGVSAMVKLEQRFEPQNRYRDGYIRNYALYQRLAAGEKSISSS